MEVILKGKVKTVYQGDDAHKVIIEYHDKVTAGNGEKEDYPLGKGALCCSISSLLFERLSKEGIPTHYMNMVGANKMICRKVDIVPLEVICRNRAAGSIVRETTLNEGQPLPQPIVEFFLKDDSKNDPLLTPDRVRLMGYDPQPFIDMTLRINDLLRQMFYILGIDLVDFKLEYGYDAHGDLYLADEISPDSMRLWQTGTNERFDKDLFRKDEGDIVPAYRHILDKLRHLALV
jgi:phosphoribosylaminoimidazole-succinocarboxamide synthase|tara:strand:- start:1252 stop:1950 length:699 start_codon:yes stop_codon:yes gene_type:complete